MVAILFLTSEAPGTGVALPLTLGGEQAEAVAVSAALVLYSREVFIGAIALPVTVSVLCALRADPATAAVVQTLLQGSWSYNSHKNEISWLWGGLGAPLSSLKLIII